MCQQAFEVMGGVRVGNVLCLMSRFVFVQTRWGYCGRKPWEIEVRLTQALSDMVASGFLYEWQEVPVGR